MIPRVLKFAAILVGMAAVWLPASPVAAEIVSQRYPNAYYGPWFMELNARILDPDPGSKWAFGMTTVCQVPHLAISSYYGSTSAGYPIDTYNGAQRLDWHHQNGYGDMVDATAFDWWTPPTPGGSRSMFCPMFGDNGYYGSAQNITVLGGYGTTSLISTMSTVTTYPRTQIFSTAGSMWTCDAHGEDPCWPC